VITGQTKGTAPQNVSLVFIDDSKSVDNLNITLSSKVPEMKYFEGPFTQKQFLCQDFVNIFAKKIGKIHLLRFWFKLQPFKLLGVKIDSRYIGQKWSKLTKIITFLTRSKKIGNFRENLQHHFSAKMGVFERQRPIFMKISANLFKKSQH
jgi:hypothetical protein